MPQLKHFEVRVVIGGKLWVLVFCLCLSILVQGKDWLSRHELLPGILSQWEVLSADFGEDLKYLYARFNWDKGLIQVLELSQP